MDDHRSDCIHTCAKSLAWRSFRNLICNHDRGIRKIESKVRNTIDNSTRLNLILDLSNLISRNKFSRENAPTQQEIMTTCPALSAYNYNRKIKNILSILALYIFKKLQNRHTNTFISRFSRIILGFKSLF